MTKHDAMKEYFEPKVRELAGVMLNFNFSPGTKDSIAFITNYSDKVIRRYLHGRSEKEYGFTIIINKEYSTYQDDLNLEAMNFAQAFMDWLDGQERQRNYPKFSDNCQIKKIENLQNMPNLAGVNMEENLARYMIQCRVIYYEEERRR